MPPEQHPTLQQTLDMRRANLRAIVWELFESRQDFLRICSWIKPAYLSQMIGRNATRPVSERTARRIETALGLPSDWLDEQPSNSHMQTAHKALTGLVGVVRDIPERQTGKTLPYPQKNRKAATPSDQTEQLLELASWIGEQSPTLTGAQALALNQVAHRIVQAVPDSASQRAIAIAIVALLRA